MKLNSDFVDLLGAFATEKVNYVVVGGYAVAFHGHPRFTKDLDLFIEASQVNISRAVAALEQFGAPNAVRDAIRNLSGLDVAWMGNPPLRIDFMVNVPGVEFQEAHAHRDTFKAADIEISVISLNDLLTAKRASGRPQDLADVEALLALTSAKSAP